jgi:hypothetical protein
LGNIVASQVANAVEFNPGEEKVWENFIGAEEILPGDVAALKDG